MATPATLVLAMLSLGSTLDRATYFGGVDSDDHQQVATDEAGNIYLAFSTRSPDLPVVGAIQPTLRGLWDIYLAKLTPDGQTILFSTYLGGLFMEQLYGLAVDAVGNAYLTGHTESGDFPAIGAIQPLLKGRRDVFLAKLDTVTPRVVFSTFLGGGGWDGGSDVAVDRAGRIYVVGSTESSDFPTANPLIPSLTWSVAAFVAKLDPDGAAFVYSTYLGGSGRDWLDAVAVDETGSAYLAGGRDSADFPGGCAPGPDSPWNDAVLLKLDPAGQSIVWCSSLSGTGTDYVKAVALDGQGSVYVAGFTNSADLGTAGAAQPRLAGSRDGFVAKVSTSGGPWLYVSYVGGASNDTREWAADLTVDALGQAIVVGETDAPDFPTLSAFQCALRGPIDAYAAQLATDGSRFLWSSFLGGSAGEDSFFSVALDPGGGIHFTGRTHSEDFPVPRALQPGYGGQGDAFLARILPGQCELPGDLGNQLRVVRAGIGEPRLLWEDLPGTTEYRVYEDTRKDGAFAALAGSASSGSPGIALAASAEPLVLYRVVTVACCVEGPR